MGQKCNRVMIVCLQKGIVRLVGLCCGKRILTFGALNLLLLVLRSVQEAMARLPGISPPLNPMLLTEALHVPCAASSRCVCACYIVDLGSRYLNSHLHT